MRSLRIGLTLGLLIGSLLQADAGGANSANNSRRSPFNWGADTSVNTPVCVAAGWQTAPMVINDGLGGSIIFWQDQRKGSNVNTTDFDIYAQRLNAAGEPQWTQNGVPIATDALSDVYPRAVSDGKGGAVVIWLTQPLTSGPSSIRAQRIDSTGAAHWAAAGVTVDSFPNVIARDYDIVTDGKSGAIISSGLPSGNMPEAVAKRIDSSGVLRWGSQGVLLAPASPQGQGAIFAAPDGAGGAIVALQDFRYQGTDSAGSLFMQRVDSSGALLWGQGGVAVSNHAVLAASMITHAPGDFVVTWLQHPWPGEPVAYRIFAQRLDGGGNARWLKYGAPVSPIPAQSQAGPDICDDRRGGAIISWEEYGGDVLGIFAQRLDSSGTTRWAAPGIRLVNVPATSDPIPEIVENGNGGAIVIWEDYRNTTPDPTNVDIFAQGIGADGSLAWQDGGIPVTTAPKTQKFSTLYKRGIALTDTSGVAVVAWEDARDSTVAAKDPGQIYAARLVYPAGPATGISGGPRNTPGTFRLDHNYPNPFNPNTTIGYRLATTGHVSLDVYNLLGEKIVTLVDGVQTPGEHKAVFNGAEFASGVYFYRLKSGSFIQTESLLLLK